MILQVRFTFWWSLKFKKLNSFIFSWNEVGRRNFNFVTWKIKNFRKLATGHSRNYLVTIGNLGYLKLVKSDMYPKFLEINLVVVVRHSEHVCWNCPPHEWKHLRVVRDQTIYLTNDAFVTRPNSEHPPQRRRTRGHTHPGPGRGRLYVI